MNNPMMLISNMIRSGNPIQALQQMAGNDPRISQFLQMVNGKSPEQLQTIAENMARERGVNIQQIAQQLGISR